MDAELQCIRDAGNSKKSVVYDYWDRDRSCFFVFADCRRSIGKYDYVSVPESDFLNAGKRLYEDSVTGRISDERFTELSADYEAEQRELKERAAAIQAELSKAQEATVNAEKFMNVVRRHTSFEELTPTLLREFVEKIVVHECSYDENKTRRQDIEICLPSQA